MTLCLVLSCMIRKYVRAFLSGFCRLGLTTLNIPSCRRRAEVDLKDKTHHVIFNAAAYEQEKDSDIKDFLSFVKTNTARSDFTRGIANMVQTKKFEQTFINEYMAWNLHEQDVLERGRNEGRIETAKKLLLMGLPFETIAKGTELSIEFIKQLSKQK